LWLYSLLLPLSIQERCSSEAEGLFMRTAIKLIFCLAIVFACQTKEISAQVVNNTAGAFPTPDGLTLKGAAEVPMSLAKATEKYNNYYQASPVEGWTAENKIIVKEYGRTVSLLTYAQPEGQPTSILTFPQPAYDIYPSPDRKNYLYNQDTDGKLNYRMFVWNQESKQSVALTDIGTRSVQPIWSPSGKYVAYSYSAPGTRGMEIAWRRSIGRRGAVGGRRKNDRRFNAEFSPLIERKHKRIGERVAGGAARSLEASRAV